jgi:hypothetical protein
LTPCDEPNASSTGTKNVYPPLVDTFSTSPKPPGKRVSNWVKPLGDLEEVGSLSASDNLGGSAMTYLSAYHSPMSIARTYGVHGEDTQITQNRIGRHIDIP